MKVIHVLRKPLSEKTIAANVLAHGTGALNIDACPVSTDDDLNGGAYSAGGRASLPGDLREGASAGMYREGGGRLPGQYQQPSGRWPSNLILEHAPECRCVRTQRVRGITGGMAAWECTPICPAAALDASGASRFFKQVGGGL